MFLRVSIISNGGKDKIVRQPYRVKGLTLMLVLLPCMQRGLDAKSKY